MCTIFISFDDETETILFGINRDEWLERPSEQPAIHHTSNRKPYIAPLDKRKGGTWFAITSEQSLFCLTNRYSALHEDDRRSRGKIIPELVEFKNRLEIMQALRLLDPSDFNPFHLVIAADNDLITAVSDGRRLNVFSGPERPHFVIITERSFGAAPNKKKKELFKRLREQTSPSLYDVKTWLSTKNSDEGKGPCLCYPAFSYGTKSSTIGKLNDTPQLIHAEGPPCQTSYEDLSGLFDSLEAE